MPWREVATTVGDWRSGSYYNSLNDLHSREDRRDIRQSLIQWERGRINPYGGWAWTSFDFQSRPTQEELQAILGAIAEGWLHWKHVLGADPVISIEREGMTPTGERIEYEMVGERRWFDSGELRVRLPVSEDRLLATNGFVYRRMGINRQLSRYVNLSPVITEAGECFGFATVRHEPTKDQPIAVVCISPMQVSSVPILRDFLHEAAELGCQISLTLHATEWPKYYHAKMLLKRRDGEWFFTFVVTGGERYWRLGMIDWFETNGPPIPVEAMISYLERYEAPPKTLWLRLPQTKLPDTKLGRAVGFLLGLVVIPFVLAGAGFGRGFSFIGNGLSTIVKTASAPVAKLWRRLVTEPRERRRKEERERKLGLIDLFEALQVPPQKERAETCFLAVSDDVAKNPRAAIAKLTQGKQDQIPDAEGDA